LDADGDAAEVDRRDRLVVAELLPAGGSLFLGALDEALLQRDGVTVDAAELVVDDLHREVRAIRGRCADHLLSTLLVDPADVDRRLARVGLPSRPAYVLHIVRYGLVTGTARACCRRRRRGRRSGGSGAGA